MPPDTEPANGTQPVAPSTATPAPDPAPPQITTATGKVLPLTQEQIGKLKKQEREKGARQVAKDLGFESVEAMKLALERSKNRTAQQPTATKPAQDAKPATPQTAAPSAGGVDGKAYAKLQREHTEAQEKLRRLAREKANAEKVARQSRQELQAKDAESELRLAAVRGGVRDPEYALHLVKKHLAGQTEEQLKAFDEVKYFEGLRASHAYLFGETVQPVNTAPGGKPSVTATKPTTTTVAGNGSADMRTVTREQFDQRLKQLGINTAH